MPLTLVAGFDGAGKTALIHRWVAQRPPGERWAVVANGFGLNGPGRATDENVDVFPLLGGCACCSAAVMLRPLLHRILRRGPWHRILFELADAGHTATLVDRLREACRGAPLQLDAVIAVVDARRPAPFLTTDADGAALARAQAECADLIVLTGSEAYPESAALRVRLSDGVFGPRPVLGHGTELPSGSEVLDALRRGDPDAGPAHSLPGGGRRWMRPRDGAVEFTWRWPPEAGFDRRRAEAWAAQAAQNGALHSGLAVFPTRRDWYLWRYTAGQSDWRACDWRRDARVVCRFENSPQAGWIEAFEHGLVATLESNTGGP